MSELISTNNNQNTRRRLLSTASALTVLASFYAPNGAAASNDIDRPTVWIELGAEMDRLSGQGENFPLGFLPNYSGSSVLQNPSPSQAQNPLPFTFGGVGKLSFEPSNSDLVFSAAIRYGRSSNKKKVHHQTTSVHPTKYQNGKPLPSPSGNIHLFTDENFANTTATHRESHTVLDFTVGKDVGLGMFGHDASSVFNVGVRFAQFSSRMTVDIRARPDVKFKYYPSAASPNRANIDPYFHSYHVTGSAWRNFHGIGPSLSWNASVPVVGNIEAGEVAFDWGVNAALLFGRQKAHAQHQETGTYVSWQAGLMGGIAAGTVLYQEAPPPHNADRAVTVPNIGGFAGLSFDYSSAKVSLGYRADFFIGAIDGGIDARKSETLGFYGPFATVSIGLGG